VSEVREAPRDVTSELDALSVVDVVDLLLARLANGWMRSIVLEAAGDRHAIRWDDGERSDVLATLDEDRARAVTARLAVLAGLRLEAPGTQLGKVRVRMRQTRGSDHTAASDLLVAVRWEGQGARAEVHLVAPQRQAQTLVAPRPSSPPLELASDDELPKYRILEELGRGGMGVVYRGEHVALQKAVAIKVLHPEAAQEPVLAAQFVVEARAACRARHPGIVEVTDFGALADGRAFIVMELVEAPTLSRLLQEQGTLEPMRALQLAGRIAEALAAAAAHGVVHRDLTPANIFVLPGDHPKIGDFGVARILDPRATPAGALETGIVGTAIYMSPEQGRGDAVDVRSDIYSLGCVLFRMITGRVPFEGSTLLEIIVSHASSPVPEAVGPDGPVPEAVADVINRALAKDPADRYATPEELVSAVRLVLEAP
jgi:tRNA A-37 threonylcarbamoyl transferase component Bud32